MKKRKGINWNAKLLVIIVIGTVFALLVMSSFEGILQTILTEQIEKSMN
jgi:hypothetical protein